MSEQEPVIGIDLGTTNSVVATVQGGQPRVIQNRTGQNLTPSVVAVHDSRASGWWGSSPSGRPSPTPRTRSTPPSGSSAGVSSSDAGARTREGAALPAGGRASTTTSGCSSGGKAVSLPEISRRWCWRELKADAEAFFGRPVTQGGDHRARLLQRRPAPGHQGRRAHRRAGRAAHHQRAHRGGAGLRLRQDRSRRRSPSSTSAAAPSTSRVLEVGKGVFDVIATGGDTYLGGEDFDNRIIDWLVMDFAKEHGVDLRQDKMALQRLKDAAEKAKIELSDASTRRTIHLPFLCTPPGGERGAAPRRRRSPARSSRSSPRTWSSARVDDRRQGARRGRGARRRARGDHPGRRA